MPGTSFICYAGFPRQQATRGPNGKCYIPGLYTASHPAQVITHYTVSDSQKYASLTVLHVPFLDLIQHFILP